MHADEKRLRKEMEYAYMEEKNKRKELENIIINLEDELVDLAKASDPDGYTHYIPMKLTLGP